MKHTLLLLLIIASFTADARKITLISGNGYAVSVDATHPSPFLPGDTVLISSSVKWTYFSLTNIHGTALQPIVFMNYGGQVQLSNGFAIQNCTYIKVLGIGSTDKYGFYVSNPLFNGVSVDIFGRSSNVEVSNIDIYKNLYGFWIKEEQQCTDSLNALTPANPLGWTIDNISVHDCRIVKMNQEGMYMGSTDPNGIRGVSCNGKTIYPTAMRLSNIHVYNMIIDSCNRSGMQLSGANAGNNRLNNNHITHVGLELNTQQGPGIWLGGFTTARVDHNTVSSTYLGGIFCLGAGWQYIDSNTIDSSGILGTVKANGMAGIMVDTRPTTNPVDSAFVSIIGNSIGANTDVPIHIMNDYCCYGKGNVICGNTPKVDPPNITYNQNNVPFTYRSICLTIPPPPVSVPVWDTIARGTVYEVDSNKIIKYYIVK